MRSTEGSPATRDEIALSIDLSDRKERERLSSEAVPAFFNIMACWKICDEDASRLLGGISKGTYSALKKEQGKQSRRTLDEDQLLRISYLIGIFKALNIIHGEALADRWMLLPNGNRIFGGISPCEYLMRGGLPAFATLRKLLDSRRLSH